MNLDFTPSKDVKAIETVVHGLVMNIATPFPLPQTDGCKNNVLTCPLKAGQKATYVVMQPVLRSYPKVKVVVKWVLKNEDRDNLICILIPSRIN
ncbi:unnamed protein product [Parnassius apollo]|uniref:(apollo) hypothetical protein n=1 Tax=Parnassius apollo TaxID=110799 RepID=A0A8S3XW41_PARAO|nr:unnamed protein product [Parnassius apollo]